jgi:hypothetical protein
MDRRGFLTTLIGGIAGTAAVRTWPFRVYSFPADIVRVDPFKLPEATLDQLNAITIKYLNPVIANHTFTPSPMWKHFAQSGEGIGVIDPFRLRRG